MAVACLRRSSYELEIFLAFGGRLDRQPGRDAERKKKYKWFMVILVDLAVFILVFRQVVSLHSSILKSPDEGPERR